MTDLPSKRRQDNSENPEEKGNGDTKVQNARNVVLNNVKNRPSVVEQREVIETVKG